MCLTEATEGPAVLRVPSWEAKRRNEPLVKVMAAPEETTITSDAIKMFSPCPLKPDSLEMGRILAVLDETMAKLELSSLIPHVVDSLDRFAGVLGPELTDSLMEHQQLSNDLEQLLASSGDGDTRAAEERRGCLCALEQHLKRSVRNILRFLLADPSLCRALKDEAWARESPAEEFLKAFGEFRGFMLERLLTSPAEEEESARLLAGISLQVKNNTEAIAALQAELAAATRAREEEILKKETVIKDLQTSVRDLTAACRAVTQQIRQEGEHLQEQELQASATRRAGLQQHLQQLQAQLDALVLEHRASELALRRRNCRAETEIGNWIQKYDTDMVEKQAEYEELCTAYAEEKAQLSLLMEKRALLLQEYSQIQEERRVHQEQKEQALQELATMTRAAIRIQAFWRGYLVRSLLRPKRKKKKQGKGKKAKK